MDQLKIFPKQSHGKLIRNARLHTNKKEENEDGELCDEPSDRHGGIIIMIRSRDSGERG